MVTHSTLVRVVLDLSASEKCLAPSSSKKLSETLQTSDVASVGADSVNVSQCHSRVLATPDGLESLVLLESISNLGDALSSVGATTILV